MDKGSIDCLETGNEMCKGYSAGASMHHLERSSPRRKSGDDWRFSDEQRRRECFGSEKKEQSASCFTTETLKQRWCRGYKTAGSHCHRKLYWLSARIRKTNDISNRTIRTSFQREISHRSTLWHIESSVFHFSLSSGSTFNFHEANGEFSQTILSHACTIDLNKSVWSQTNRYLSHHLRSILFVFNKAFYILVCSRGNRNLLREENKRCITSSILPSFDILLFFCFLSQEGCDEGVVSPPTRKPRKCKHCEQAREECEMSIRCRCQCLGSIFRHTVAQLGTGAEGMQVLWRQVHRHHFSKWVNNVSGILELIGKANPFLHLH